MERRRFIRVPFDLEVEVSSALGAWKGRLVNMSLQGLLIEFVEPWPGQLRERYSVKLVGLEGEGIRMEADVSHVSTQRAGFVCRQMDMESMYRLRDLVEHYADDKERFMRELKDWW